LHDRDRSGSRCHLGGALDQRLLERIAVDAAAEAGRDLEDLGAQVEEEVQVRGALAEVVERDAQAEIAQGDERGGEGARVDDRVLFGELQDDAAMVQPDREHGVDQPAGELRIGQRARLDVQKDRGCAGQVADLGPRARASTPKTSKGGPPGRSGTTGWRREWSGLAARKLSRSGTLSTSGGSPDSSEAGDELTCCASSSRRSSPNPPGLSSTALTPSRRQIARTLSSRKPERT